MSVSDALFGRLPFQHLPVDRLVQWGEHLSVDQPAIDAQHKAIFDLGTRIHDEWSAGGGARELPAAVDKLTKLLAAHFAYEERLLAEIGYADLERHAAEHRGMLADLAAIRGRLPAADEVSPAGLPVPGWPVVQLILELTIGHVMNSDMSYRQALIDSRDVVQGTA